MFRKSAHTKTVAGFALLALALTLLAGCHGSDTIVGQPFSDIATRFMQDNAGDNAARLDLKLTVDPHTRIPTSVADAVALLPGWTAEAIGTPVITQTPTRSDATGQFRVTDPAGNVQIINLNVTVFHGTGAG